MTVLGFVLGLYELVFLSVFFVVMVIAIAADNAGTPEPKWWTLVIGLGLFAGLTWSDWTVSGIMGVVTGAAFWVLIAKYLGVGLAYSMLEFARAVRLSAKNLKASWERFLDQSDPSQGYGKNHNDTKMRDLLLKTVVVPGDDELIIAAKSEETNRIKRLFTSNHVRHDALITPVLDRDDGEIKPRVSRHVLASYISAWTFFWPFYLLAMIFGDLLFEVFSVISNAVVAMSNRTVAMVFKDTFKV
jgi:hypothetical protein